MTERYLVARSGSSAAYNQAWKNALDSLGRSPALDDVLRLREQITKQFGIDIYSRIHEDLAVASPRDSEFAEVERRGGWVGPQGGEPCPACGTSRLQRAQPLRIVWRPGLEHVGDFVWTGVGPEVIAAEHVVTSLLSRFEGFEAGPVKMLDDLELSVSERKLPRVDLPYSGPPLYELRVTSWLDIDIDRSSVELERRCEVCGTEFWEAYGIERWDSHFDMERRELVRDLVPRAPNGGLIVPEAERAGVDIFRVRQFPGWTLCTDPVREHVEKDGYSNVSFLELGETF